MNEETLFEHRIYLEFPDKESIKQAYLDLPHYGRLEILCNTDEINQTILYVSEVGFFGTILKVLGILGPIVRICTYKGKSGPCYDTGRTVRYKGAAFAVLDDDFHIITGSTRVCEKTANIYSLKIYKEFLETTPADPEKLKLLHTNPIPFSCETFEDDVKKLVNHFSENNQADKKMTYLLYPGPFRLMILEDGTIVRRGNITMVTDFVANQLKTKDGCIILKSNVGSIVTREESFPKLFNQQGVLCLLESPSNREIKNTNTSLHLSVLNKISENFLNRIERLISGNENYILLTGSDPWDKYGCCPSDDVGSANRLVEASILQAWQTNTAPDSCPCTIYAFKDEIIEKDGKPVFSINTKLRRKVLTYLKKLKAGIIKIISTILTWVLLTFVIFSIGYAVIKTPKNFLKGHIGQQSQISLDSVSLDLNDCIYILYFYFSKPCPICKGMENTLDLIFTSYFKKEIEEKTIVYKTVIIDSDVDSTLINTFGIIQSSIVLVEIENKKILRYKKFNYELWRLINNEKGYAEFTKNSILDFLEDK